MEMRRNRWLFALKAAVFLVAPIVIGGNAIGVGRTAPASQPATEPATQPAANDVEPADYCTVLLAPKLRTNLGLSQEQRDKLDDLNTLLKTRLDACADDTVPHIGPMRQGITPGIISARARIQLAEVGKQVRDVLTPEQAARLSDLFDKGQLQPISVSASVDRNMPRFGPNAGKVYETTAVQLSYTHFGESSDASSTAGAAPKPLPQASGLPPTASRDDSENAHRSHFHPRHDDDTTPGATPAVQGPQLALVRTAHLTCSGGVRRVVYSADGSTLASVDDQAVRFWNVAEEHPPEVNDLNVRAEHLGKINGIALSPDGKLLVTGSDDHSVRLYAIGANGLKRLDVAMGHDSAVWNVAFAPDGKSVFSAGDDMNVVRWKIDADHLVEQSRIKIDGVFGVKSLAVTGNLTVNCSCGNGNVSVVDFSTDAPAVKSTYKERSESFLLPMATNPKDGSIAVGSGRTIMLLGGAAPAPANPPPASATSTAFSTTTKRITSIAWSPDAKFFATGTDDGHLLVWDPTGKIRYTFDAEKRFNDVTFVPVADAGEMLIAGANDDGTIYLLRLKSDAQ